jgi:hypothetical protein
LAIKKFKSNYIKVLSFTWKYYSERDLKKSIHLSCLNIILKRLYIREINVDTSFGCFLSKLIVVNFNNIETFCLSLAFFGRNEEKKNEWKIEMEIKKQFFLSGKCDGHDFCRAWNNKIEELLLYLSLGKKFKSKPNKSRTFAKIQLKRIVD